MCCVKLSIGIVLRFELLVTASRMSYHIVLIPIRRFFPLFSHPIPKCLCHSGPVGRHPQGMSLTPPAPSPGIVAIPGRSVSQLLCALVGYVYGQGGHPGDVQCHHQCPALCYIPIPCMVETGRCLFNATTNITIAAIVSDNKFSVVVEKFC